MFRNFFYRSQFIGLNLLNFTIMAHLASERSGVKNSTFFVLSRLDLNEHQRLIAELFPFMNLYRMLVLVQL